MSLTPALSKDHHDDFGSSSHIVQFYETDTHLSTVVANFLAVGLMAGQPVIVIATAAHRTAISACLSAQGFDVAAAIRRGQLILLDAEETLATFMVGQMPDAHRFRATTEVLIERSCHGRQHTRMRLYGEMVDLLWQQGNPEGAIHLEALWNELAKTYTFSLLCGYAVSNFDQLTHVAHLSAICAHHQHILPAEITPTA